MPADNGNRDTDCDGKDSANARTPFFLLGCPRSGTSVLSRILNTHRNLAVPLESQFFPHYYPIIDSYGDLSDKVNQRALVEDLVRSERLRIDWRGVVTEKMVWPRIKRPGFGGVFEAILSAYAASQGKPRWGEKTPQNTLFPEALSALFPNARYVHIKRDGRDVALSLLKTRFGPKTVFRTASYWKNYIARMDRLRQRIPASQIHDLSYEQLLADPQRTLESLCDFLGESYDPAMLLFYAQDHSDNIDPTNARNLNKPLSAFKPDKWRTQMQQRDQFIFESVAGDALRALGYETIFDEPTLTVRDRLIGRYGSIHRRLWGMLRNRRAQSEMVYRLRCKYGRRLRAGLHSNADGSAQTTH